MRSRMLWLAVLVVAFAGIGFGQGETATVSGRVTDVSGAVIPNAAISVIDQATKVERYTVSNNDGLYVVAGLKPGTYRIIVKREGFSQFVKTDIVLHVQDAVAENFELRVGSTSESVTVRGDQANINTESASVGTVIDSKFVSELPLNGRSIQTLISLAPGMVNTPVSQSGSDQGQYSANGMRTNGNYFTVDGVSADFGVPVFEGLSQGASGSLPATNIQGGFTNLVSVDALQEFKIQTSTFAPEFGRSPGAQVSLVTKGGSNKWHGAVYDYFRNDAMDAINYFDTPATKPPLRYNDFGGTFAGPVRLPGYNGRDKTFFFFSYEGQRFLLPQPQLITIVPSLSARQNAPNAQAKALLDAFALPNGADVLDSSGNPTGGALLRASFSNLNVSNAYSLRLDQNFTDKYSMFVRYNYAPSYADSRGGNISELDRFLQNTTTFTLGATQAFVNSMVNEVRVNYSREGSEWQQVYDGFGGGQGLPAQSIFLPGNSQGRYGYGIESLIDLTFAMGPNANYAMVNGGPIASNAGRVANLVDNFSWLKGSHQLKFGFDYRWVSPIQDSAPLIDTAYFNTVNDPTDPMSLYAGTAFLGLLMNNAKSTEYGHDISLYAQDTYHVNNRLSMTYGVRWEIVPPPSLGGGKQNVTLAAPPDLAQTDQTSLKVAPLGTPYYSTSYTRFAPRFGFAYQINSSANHMLVLRAGAGIFYDLGSTPFNGQDWPYSHEAEIIGMPLPLTQQYLNANLATTPNFTPSPSNPASVVAASPNFTLPRTYQWNMTLEQEVGKSDTLTVGYVGSAGRDLLVTNQIVLANTPIPGYYYNPNFSSVTYVDNAASSDYNSLQVQYSHRLSKSLQGLLNYTWAHSEDNSSSDSEGLAPGSIPPVSAFWGNSSFDVRHSLTAAITYDVPTPQWNAASRAILGGWGVSTNAFVRSGLPFDVPYETIDTNIGGYEVENQRAALVPGQPLWIYNPSVPGQRELNVKAFTDPAPGTYGMGRNSLYGFSAWQDDFGLHRNFKVAERLNMEFRAELFNIFNHPNFANPDTGFGNFGIYGGPFISPTFGQAVSTLNRGFGGGGNTGGFNPLFQNGGPRSIQLALRLSF